MIRFAHRDPLDAAIIFAPVGPLVPAALWAVAKGGTVVCGRIHMSDIPSFPYRLLWEERVVRSVANLTRKDGEEFLALAPKVPVRSEVVPFPLREANEALRRLRAGELRGAAVLATEFIADERIPLSSGGKSEPDGIYTADAKSHRPAMGTS